MTLGEYRLYSPYYALFDGLDEHRSTAMSERFNTLSEDARDFLTSEQLAGELQTLVEEGTVRPQFRTAVGKIIALVALGDISIATVPELLFKLGMPQDDAFRVVSVLSGSLEVLDDIREMPTPVEREEPPEPTMKQVPPLTQRIGATVQTPTPGFRPAPNTVVDLRNKPQT